MHKSCHQFRLEIPHTYSSEAKSFLQKRKTLFVLYTLEMDHVLLAGSEPYVFYITYSTTFPDRSVARAASFIIWNWALLR